MLPNATVAHALRVQRGQAAPDVAEQLDDLECRECAGRLACCRSPQAAAAAGLMHEPHTCGGRVTKSGAGGGGLRRDLHGVCCSKILMLHCRGGCKARQLPQQLLRIEADVHHQDV